MNATVAQDSIAAARALLPAWTIWGNDFFFVVAAVVLSVLLTKLGVWVAIRPFRAAQPREWFEQARMTFPVRRVVPVAGLAYPLLIAICGFFLHHALSPFPRPLLSIITAVIILLLIVAIYRQFAFQIGFEAVRFRDTMRSGTTWVLLLLPHLVIALVIMTMMPDQFDSRAWLLLALTAVVATALVAGGNLVAARLLGLARPASARLAEIAARSSAKTGISAKGVYEIDWRMVNALAFPLSSRLAFTKQALAKLTDEELEAICAHELAHLAEPKHIHFLRVVVGTAGALFFPAIIPTVGTFGISGLAVLFCAFLAMNSAFVALSRRMEQRADAMATVAGTGDAAYARALEHLYRLNLLPVVTGLKCQTHPELYDRMVACGVQPEYPRPPAPSRRRGMAALVVMFLPIPFVMGTFPFVVDALADRAVSTEASIHRLLILPIDEAWCLDQLGRIRDEAGKPEDAAVFFQAASAINRAAWHYPASLARTYLNAKRLDDAESALREVRARSPRGNGDAAAEKWIDEFEQAIKARRDVGRKPRARRAGHTLL
jgi:Zn-dependent protease with chaperone function